MATDYYYLSENRFKDWFLLKLQESLDRLAVLYNKRLFVRSQETEYRPSKCEVLEIPTTFTYKTVKDVLDNEKQLQETAIQYSLIDRTAVRMLESRKMKDRVFVDVSFVATNRAPVCKHSALLFCWKKKGSKR